MEDFGEYVGRMEIDGFGHVFLPDTETEQGDVPSLGRWVEDNTGGESKKPEVRRVRITVKLLPNK